MRTLAVLALATLTLAGAGPVVSQTPTLEQALREARDYSPLPLTLAYEQAQWEIDHQRVIATEGLDPQDDLDARIEDLQRQTARDRRLASTIFRDGVVLGGACVTDGLQGCASSTGGYLSIDDRRPLQWQLQSGFTAEDGVSGGIVFIGDAGAARMGPTAPVAWGFDAAWYQAPIVLSGAEFGDNVYVVVPGVHAGSGGGNADLLFRWNAHATPELSQIDTWSWREGLRERLPSGLEISQGLRFNWAVMNAFTPLSQAGDGACCGTGGAATLSFSIQGDRLVLDNITVRDGLLEAASRTPTEVFGYARRWFGCARFGDEEAYDAERAAQIETAVADLRCTRLPADGAALKRKYSDDPRTLAAIERAEALGR
ncbi:MAG: hypothetical protein M3Q74_12415 [Pseudomonadota bacterium]|nr:hypothetical protein [Pseudomonadota bacterium]